MIENSKIAIITTVANFKLYSKTATIFPKGIDKIVIDGTTGIYGLASINIIFKMLKNKQYEWVIMADEDLFFYNSNIVFDLIEHMNENNYHICGIRDGGFVKHRVHNPAAINTFFSIINFKELSKFFNYRSVLTYQKYIPELYINKNYTSFKYNYDIESLKEPYYCFYFWALMQEFRFLYLETINPVGDDEIGNIILDTNGNKIAFHSWYARAYEVYEDQTTRINIFLQDFNIENSSVDFKSIEIIRKPFFNWKKRFTAFIKPLLQN